MTDVWRESVLSKQIWDLINKGVFMSCDTSKFGKGDIVSIEGTITSAQLLTGNHYVQLTSGIEVVAAPSRLTLVKKAVPPKPRAGSILRKKNKAWNNCLYTITHDGRIMLIGGDGDSITRSGDHQTWETDHQNLEVVVERQL